MTDQAEVLRRIVNDQHTPIARVVAVTSGKGGVGKTNLAVNLSLALTNMQQRVVLLDADLGMANADLVLGVYPKYSLNDVYQGTKTIHEIIIEGPQGLRLIAGSSGNYDIANMGEKEIERLINSISFLEKHHDFFMIDTGAGVSRSVLDFLVATDEILVVVTSEPTSIADAYGLIKALNKRDAGKSISIVANMVRSPKDGELVWNGINSVVKRFLGVEVGYAGYVLYDEKVRKSVRDQEPFYISYPNSSIARSLDQIAKYLVHNQSNFERPSGFKSFISRLTRKALL